MKRIFSTLALVAALAIGHSPPAAADTWSGSTTGTGLFHAQTSSAGQATVLDFFFRADGSPDWRICSGPWGYSTKYFDGPCQAFSNGATFGGSYVAPTGLGSAGWLSVDWASYTDGQSVGVDDRELGVTYLSSDRSRLGQNLTRTTIKAGRPRPDALVEPWHGQIWYDPAEPGTGVTSDFQGDYGFFAFFGYSTVNGQSEFRIATGAMTTATTGSFDFQRCATISAGTVACASEGTVTMQLATVTTNGGGITLRRLDVTYPNGVTKRYAPYAF